MNIIKWSKECTTCGRRYPSTCGIANCLECKVSLERVQKSPTVTEEEWDQLAFIYGRVIPGPLSEEERNLMEAEWEVLEAEAERRAPWFSVADLIGEGFRSVRPTA